MAVAGLNEQDNVDDQVSFCLFFWESKIKEGEK